MTPEELEKLLKLIALIQQGAKALTEVLANKATQGDMTTEEIFMRAEQHNEEALSIINDL